MSSLELERKRPAPSSDELENNEEEASKKRARVEEDDHVDDKAESGDIPLAGSEISYKFLDKAVFGKDGRRYHNSIRLNISPSQSIIVRKGDAVVLFHDDDEEDAAWVVCVDRFFIEDSEDENHPKGTAAIKETLNDVKMLGQWFVRPNDLKNHLEQIKGFSAANIQKMLDQMKPDEVILSNLVEEHDASAILRICKFKDPKLLESGDHDSYAEVDGNESLLFCRYKLDVDVKNALLKWTDYNMTSAEHKGSTASSNNNDESAQDGVSSFGAHDDDDEEDDDDDDDDSTSTIEEQSRAIIQEGEGSTLRGDIAVGEKYQMVVGPFDPTLKATVRSRNPKLIWKVEDRLSEDDMHQFLCDLAEIHIPYLEENGLIILDEPYTPLPMERAEQIMRENIKEDNSKGAPVDNYKFLTGSCMSTASMLGSGPDHEKRNRLLRECDVDKVLELLRDHKNDTKAALEAVKKNLDSITIGWNKAEREIFDAGYRRHQAAALRMIGKALTPATKDMKSVVDYFYHFKIPDQFRKYQDMKREQAVRIVECIENRKAMAELSTSSTSSAVATQYQQAAATVAIGNSQTDGNSHLKLLNSHSGSHWSDKTISNVADARDERIRIAKKLLLDVKDTLGKDVMKEVAAILRQLQTSYTSEMRNSLFRILPDQPELKKRFLEFLPKPF